MRRVAQDAAMRHGGSGRFSGCSAQHSAGDICYMAQTCVPSAWKRYRLSAGSEINCNLKAFKCSSCFPVSTWEARISISLE